MKRMGFLIGLLLGSGPLWAGSVPNQITYQGTLKQVGLPATGTYIMQFRLTNADGTTQYWTSGDVSVSVNNGLFSTLLNPTADWQNLSPYIEVSVAGQVLTPREPVTSNAYALMSQSVVDGAVTTAKLDPSVSGYLIPQGMIAIFATACPTGWAVFPGLQGHFPVGADPSNPGLFTVNVSSGNLTHSHTLTTFKTYTNGEGAGSIGWSPTIDGGTWPTALNNFTVGNGNDLYNQVNNYTDSQSNLPPYLSVIFCVKQ